MTNLWIAIHFQGFKTHIIITSKVNCEQYNARAMIERCSRMKVFIKRVCWTVKDCAVFIYFASLIILYYIYSTGRMQGECKNITLPQVKLKLFHFLCRHWVWWVIVCKTLHFNRENIETYIISSWVCIPRDTDFIS